MFGVISQVAEHNLAEIKTVGHQATGTRFAYVFSKNLLITNFMFMCIFSGH